MKNRILINAFTPNNFRNFQLEEKSPEKKKSYVGRKITIISGQNGIGKSSLMSLMASCSGTNHSRMLTNGNGNNNFNKFQPYFSEFFRIDKEKENYKEYSFFVDFVTDEKFEFTKKVSFSDYKDRGIRLIPRTQKLDNKNLEESSKIVSRNTGIGRDGRIQMPTIYLSLSRILPVGETEISKAKFRRISNELKKELNNNYIEWYTRVLPQTISIDEKKDNEIDAFKKESTSSSRFYVDMKGNSKITQSVGQDNLGAIISSLLEFKYLKETDENYHGGIFYIDEIDSTLHPDAQLKLMELLDELANDLSLQIIATSHSLTTLSYIMKKAKKDDGKRDYKVIYFRDLDTPHKSNFKYMYELKADLYNETETEMPKLNIYLEDEIGLKVFKMLLYAAKKLMIDFQVKRNDYSLYDLNLGSDQLKKLVEEKNAPLFDYSLIILDGDSKIIKNKSYNKINTDECIYNYENNYEKFKKEFEKSSYLEQLKPKNMVALPDIVFPELFVHNILKKMIDNKKIYMDFWDSLENNSETKLMDSRKIYEEYIAPLNREEKKKEKLHGNVKLIDFAMKTRMLYFFYKNEENKNDLLDWMKELNEKSDILVKKIKSEKFV